LSNNNIDVSLKISFRYNF